MTAVTDRDVRGGPSASPFGRLFRPTPSSLFSPAADVVMAGGGSLVMLLVLQLVMNSTDSRQYSAWSWAVYYLSFFVNFPHFAASYQLIYSDARSGFRGAGTTRKFTLKLWWAGAVVPMILVSYFMVCLATGKGSWMGYLANAMFLSVGWHYVKQIFGCFVVLSSAKRVYYSPLERRVVLAALYSLWASSWIAANQSSGRYDYYGIKYSTANLPAWLMTAANGLVIVTATAVVAVLALKAFNHNAWPPVSAIVAVISIYAWLLPQTSSALFILIVPAFHSLQYLLFVLAYKRNSVVASVRAGRRGPRPGRDDDQRTRAPTEPPSPSDKPDVRLLRHVPRPARDRAGAGLPQWTGRIAGRTAAVGLRPVRRGERDDVGGHGARRRRPRRVPGRCECVGGTWFLREFRGVLRGRRDPGCSAVRIAPSVMDVLNANGYLPKGLSYDSAVFGTTLYLFFFTVFVNIHHYFIDNVIWKRDNPFVRTHLVPQRPVALVPTPAPATQQ